MILDKEANGEWLQALALALDYYENYVQVLEHPNLTAARLGCFADPV
jgi:hypothetical protein